MPISKAPIGLQRSNTLNSNVLDKGKGKAIAAEDFGVDANALLDGVDFGDDEDEEDQEFGGRAGGGGGGGRNDYDESDDEVIVPKLKPKAVVTNFKLPLPPPVPPKVVPSRSKTTSEVVNMNSVAGPSNSKNTGPTADPARVSSAPKFLHPWSRDVDKALRQRFGLRGFRANQEEAINATLGGKDVFVLLPTGGGKSLCFQLPAVISSGTTRGVTIVVSPLLSLISDQCKSLEEKDIPVVFLNSTMPAADRNFAMATMRSNPPTTCLAYVTPEQVSLSNIGKRIFKILISFFNTDCQKCRFQRFIG